MLKIINGIASGVMIHHWQQREGSMIVKVAPLGERVVEVNVASGSTVGQILDVADVIANDRSIAVSNTPATLDTVVTQEGAIITLAQAMKGGKR